MHYIDQITIRNLHEKLSTRQKRWAWQNGLPLEESTRRLLIDPEYCKQFGQFLAELARRADPVRCRHETSCDRRIKQRYW